MSNGNGTKPGKIAQLQAIGGLIALGAGVVAVALVAGGAMIAAPGSASSIASAAFGVIGSIADRSTAKRGGHNSPFDPSEPQLIAGSTGAVTAAPERRQARDSANPDHGRLS